MFDKMRGVGKYWMHISIFLLIASAAVVVLGQGELFVADYGEYPTGQPSGSLVLEWGSPVVVSVNSNIATAELCEGNAQGKYIDEVVTTHYYVLVDGNEITRDVTASTLDISSEVASAAGVPPAGGTSGPVNVNVIAHKVSDVEIDQLGCPDWFVEGPDYCDTSPEVDATGPFGCTCVDCGQFNNFFRAQTGNENTFETEAPLNAFSVTYCQDACTVGEVNAQGATCTDNQVAGVCADWVAPSCSNIGSACGSASECCNSGSAKFGCFSGSTYTDEFGNTQNTVEYPDQGNVCQCAPGYKWDSFQQNCVRTKQVCNIPACYDTGVGVPACLGTGVLKGTACCSTYPVDYDYNYSVDVVFIP